MQFVGGSEADVGLKRHSVLPILCTLQVPLPNALNYGDDTGARIGTGSIPLAPNGHYSQMLATLFAVTAGIRTIGSDTPAGTQISVLGIRWHPALTFTTLPPLAK